jgi:hypothetical protein
MFLPRRPAPEWIFKRALFHDFAWRTFVPKRLQIMQIGTRCYIEGDGHVLNKSGC